MNVYQFVYVLLYLSFCFKVGDRDAVIFTLNHCLGLYYARWAPCRDSCIHKTFNGTEFVSPTKACICRLKINGLKNLSSH